jgi:hypothetical protein
MGWTILLFRSFVKYRAQPRATFATLPQMAELLLARPLQRGRSNLA